MKYLNSFSLRSEITSAETDNCVQNPDNINICFSTDNNYAQHCAVAIASILKNTKTNKGIDIFILNDGSLQATHKEKIKSLKTLRSDVNIIFLTIDKNMFQGLPLAFHFTEAIYYRFIIPHILNKLPKIIYLDSDLIVNTDIEDLYNTDLRGKYIGMVQSRMGYACLQRLNLCKGKYYCNSGVLIIDLEKFRNNNITQKLFDWITENKDIVKWFDQDTINAVLEEKIHYLDLSWNVQPVGEFCDFETSVYENIKNNPKIMHWIGCGKPWNTDTILNKDLYFKYLKYTPYKGFILKYAAITIFNHINTILSDNIFSIHNVRNGYNVHKVITFLGLKLKLRNKKKEEKIKKEWQE